MVEQRPFKALVAGSSPAQPTIDMAWVYMLRGSSGRYYIGSTENLARRLEEHRRGSNHTSHRLGDSLELVNAKLVTAAKALR
jgi:predicted GIY-YIG superfamily endonuclease